MTAERWWVRFAARWFARYQSVQGHLNLIFTAMTGVSIASGALKYFGLEWAVIPFLSLTGLGTIGFAYLYSEGGVWNQVSRDKTDMSDNYSGPVMLMDALIQSRHFAAMTIEISEREYSEREKEEIREQMREEAIEEWVNLRSGLNVKEIEEEYDDI